LNFSQKVGILPEVGFVLKRSLLLRGAPDVAFPWRELWVHVQCALQSANDKMERSFSVLFLGLGLFIGPPGNFSADALDYIPFEVDVI